MGLLVFIIKLFNIYANKMSYFLLFIYIITISFIASLYYPSSPSSSECSAQGQVLHCKRRNQGCSSAEGRSSTANLEIKAAVLPGINKCGSFPLHSREKIFVNDSWIIKKYRKHREIFAYYEYLPSCLLDLRFIPSYSFVISRARNYTKFELKHGRLASSRRWSDGRRWSDVRVGKWAVT